MSDLYVDHAALAAAGARLHDAAEALDGLGSAMPAPGDYGAAGALVSAALGLHAETSAYLGAEAEILSAAVGLTNHDLELTDSQVMDLFRLEGEAP